MKWISENRKINLPNTWAESTSAWFARGCTACWWGGRPRPSGPQGPAASLARLRSRPGWALGEGRSGRWGGMAAGTVWQDLHGGSVPCETAAGSTASSLPVTRGRSDNTAAASASDTGVLYPPMLQQGSAAPLGQGACDAWRQGLWQVGSTFQRFLDSK
jgi:hypothetical protein